MRRNLGPEAATALALALALALLLLGVCGGRPAAAAAWEPIDYSVVSTDVWMAGGTALVAAEYAAEMAGFGIAAVTADAAGAPIGNTDAILAHRGISGALQTAVRNELGPQTLTEAQGVVTCGPLLGRGGGSPTSAIGTLGSGQLAITRNGASEYDVFNCGFAATSLGVYAIGEQTHVVEWSNLPPGQHYHSLGSSLVDDEGEVAWQEAGTTSSDDWRIVWSFIPGFAESDAPSPGFAMWEHLARELNYAGDKPARPVISAGATAQPNIAAGTVSSGVLVDAVLNDAAWSDANTGHGYCVYKGMAVISVNVQLGCLWEYQAPGETTWVPLSPTPSAAVTLPKDATLRLDGSNGLCVGQNVLTFRAWDATNYNARTGESLDVSGVPYFVSTATHSIALTVDAPTTGTTGCPAGNQGCPCMVGNACSLPSLSCQAGTCLPVGSTGSTGSTGTTNAPLVVTTGTTGVPSTTGAAAAAPSDPPSAAQEDSNSEPESFMDGPLFIPILAVAAALCLCCILAILFFALRRNKGQRRDGLQSDPNTDYGGLASLNTTPGTANAAYVAMSSSGTPGTGAATPGPLPDRWRIPFADLQLGEELASGAFGVVYRGSFQGNDAVIKQLHDPSPEARADLLREAAILSELRPHASLVAFYGACVDPSAPLCLVTELVDGGSVSRLLHDSARYITGHDVATMARDLAAGIASLHRSNVLHLDIAARNLLVVGSSPLRLRICDFGLSTIIPHGEKTVSVPGMQVPLRWFCPVAYNRIAVAPSTDVYAFGITLWELTSRELPYADIDSSQEAFEHARAGGRPPMPDVYSAPRVDTTDATLQALFGIMQRCWDANEMARPTMAAVADELGPVASGAATEPIQGMFAGEHTEMASSTATSLSPTPAQMQYSAAPVPGGHESSYDPTVYATMVKNKGTSDEYATIIQH